MGRARLSCVADGPGDDPCDDSCDGTGVGVAVCPGSGSRDPARPGRPSGCPRPAVTRVAAVRDAVARDADAQDAAVPDAVARQHGPVCCPGQRIVAVPASTGVAWSSSGTVPVTSPVSGSTVGTPGGTPGPALESPTCRGTRIQLLMPQARSCPMPSASISTAVPFRPSRSQVRIRTRPVTRMRSPFFSDLWTFAARDRKAVTVYQFVGPFVHDDVLRSQRREGDARRMLEMAMPVSVTRCRGSVATMPQTVIVSFMTRSSASPGPHLRPGARSVSSRLVEVGCGGRLPRTSGLAGQCARNSGRSARGPSAAWTAPFAVSSDGSTWKPSDARRMLPTAPAGPTATQVPVLSIIDVLTVGLADLVHLGQREREAVALTGVLREEVLVVLLRTEERTERLDRRHDPAVPDVRSALHRVLEQRSLLVVRREHRRAVLGADVRALAVQLPRVVEREEDVEDDVGGDDRLVEGHRDRLGVTGRTGADRFVRRVLDHAAGVARHHVLHTLQRAVHRVEAPESITCEHERRHARHRTLLRSRNTGRGLRLLHASSSPVSAPLTPLHGRGVSVVSRTVEATKTTTNQQEAPVQTSTEPAFRIRSTPSHAAVATSRARRAGRPQPGHPHQRRDRRVRRPRGRRGRHGLPRPSLRGGRATVRRAAERVVGGRRRRLPALGLTSRPRTSTAPLEGTPLRVSERRPDRRSAARLDGAQPGSTERRPTSAVLRRTLRRVRPWTGMARAVRRDHPFVAIVVAGVIAALIGRAATKRVVALHDRESRNAAVAGRGHRGAQGLTLGSTRTRGTCLRRPPRRGRRRAAAPPAGERCSAGRRLGAARDRRHQAELLDLHLAGRPVARGTPRPSARVERQARSREEAVQGHLERWKFDSPDPDATSSPASRTGTPVSSSSGRPRQTPARPRRARRRPPPRSVLRRSSLPSVPLRRDVGEPHLGPDRRGDGRPGRHHPDRRRPRCCRQPDAPLRRPRDGPARRHAGPPSARVADRSARPGNGTTPSARNDLGSRSDDSSDSGEVDVTDRGGDARSDDRPTSAPGVASPTSADAHVNRAATSATGLDRPGAANATPGAREDDDASPYTQPISASELRDAEQPRTTETSPFDERPPSDGWRPLVACAPAGIEPATRRSERAEGVRRVPPVSTKSRPPGSHRSARTTG
ncbi:hypothetical protein Pfo_031621, partial [Paulownia fortunei]